MNISITVEVWLLLILTTMAKQDIFFSGNQVPNKLYLNEGQFKFKDISEKANSQSSRSMEFRCSCRWILTMMDGKI
jgi:hypothetical protein